MRAVKRPIEVEVWHLDSNKEMPDWVDKAWVKGIVKYNPQERVWYVRTLEGTMHAGNGDYLIQGVRGELYLCERTIFE